MTYDTCKHCGATYVREPGGRKRCCPDCYSEIDYRNTAEGFKNIVSFLIKTVPLSIPVCTVAELFFDQHYWKIIGVWTLVCIIFLVVKSYPLTPSIIVMAISALVTTLVVTSFITPKLGTLSFVQNLQEKAGRTVSAPRTPGAAQRATVTSETANFRDAPSTSSNVLKSLKKGDTLTARGEAADGWLPAEHDGTAGYISADLVSVTLAPSKSASDEPFSFVAFIKKRWWIGLLIIGAILVWRRIKTGSW